MSLQTDILLKFQCFDWYFFTPGQYQWDCPENFHESPGPGPWNWDGFTINTLTNRDLFSPRGPYNYLVCINIVATCNGDQIFNDMGTQITCIYTSWSIRNGPPKKCQILLTGADTEILGEFFLWENNYFGHFLGEVGQLKNHPVHIFSKVPFNDAPQRCPSMMPLKDAPQGYPSKMPLKDAPQRCPSRLPLKVAPQGCPSNMTTTS